ncbi:MAG TPA: 3-hydroxyacyl-ACP dehydratase FabZ family protein [Opitutaceae bacterium]
MDTDVTSRLPHRPPFLFVDEIVAETEESITTRLVARSDFDFFKGHYPGNPIMPGVLISEAVFQTGAILMGKIMRSAGVAGDAATPVLVRIENARFRSAVRPDEELTITARLKQRAGAFTFMTGSVNVGARRVMTVDFCVATASPDGRTGT